MSADIIIKGSKSAAVLEEVRGRMNSMIYGSNSYRSATFAFHTNQTKNGWNLSRLAIMLNHFKLPRYFKSGGIFEENVGRTFFFNITNVRELGQFLDDHVLLHDMKVKGRPDRC